MRQYVHQVLASCVCLLFAAEQVVHKVLSELFSLKTVAAMVVNNVNGSRETEPEQYICLCETQTIS